MKYVLSLMLILLTSACVEQTTENLRSLAENGRGGVLSGPQVDTDDKISFEQLEHYPTENAVTFKIVLNHEAYILIEYGTTESLGLYFNPLKRPILGTKVELKNLSSGTTYYYRVKAYYKDMETYSKIQSFQTTGSQPEAQAPVLNSANLISGNYQLQFSQPSGSLSPEGGYDTYINNVDQNDRAEHSGFTRTLSGLDTSIEQCFKLEARYTQLNPAEFLQSNEICVPAENNTDTQAPSVPSGLTQLSVSENSLSFSWNASSDNVGVSSYLIQQNGVTVATTTGTSYSANNLNASTTYSYRVAAQDAAGNQSAFSQTLNITTDEPAPVCIKANPSLAIVPAVMSGTVGDSFNFNVVLQNNNQNCPNEVFTLAHENLPSGFSSDLASSRTLASGASTSFTVSITTPGSASSGTSNIGIRAQAGSYFAVQNLSLTLEEGSSGGNDTFDLHTYANAASVQNEVNATTGWEAENVILESVADSSYPNNNYAIKVQSTGGQWDRVKIPFEGAIGTEVEIKVVAKRGAGQYQGIYAIEGISGASGQAITSTTYQEYIISGTLTSENPSFKIYAHANETGTSSSNSVYVASVEIIGTPLVIDTEAPSIPQNLAAAGVTPYTAGIAWNASSDNVGVSSYVIEMGGNIVGNSSTTSFTVGELEPNTTYNFRVAAKDAAGNQSAFSAPLSITTPEVNTSELKAFPSAYGPGAYVTGGRGGEVRKVTNLNDSGAGSLRAALSGTAAKIIVFAVSGTIELNSTLYIPSNTTIAGQTAPQGGITVTGSSFRCQSDSNIIVRYLRIRPNYAGDAFEGLNCKSVIFDHVSVSWGGDEVITFRGDADDISLQRILIGEGKTGSLLGDSNDPWKSERLSLHQSLFYNITHRFPNPNSNGRVDIINNVIFNFKFRMSSGHGNLQLNHVNNYYKKGCLGSMQNYHFNRMTGTTGESANAKIYAAGNLVMPDTHVDPNADNWYMWTKILFENGSWVTYPLETSYRQNTMYPLLGAALPLMSAQGAHDNVTTDVGANARLDQNGNKVTEQDSIDAMYLANTVLGNCVNYQSSSSGQNYDTFAHYINFHNSVNSNPIATGYQDTDNDGMPDAWESANGFNPNVDDSAGDADGDGYTNIEEFLNLVDL